MVTLLFSSLHSTPHCVSYNLCVSYNPLHFFVIVLFLFVFKAIILIFYLLSFPFISILLFSFYAFRSVQFCSTIYSSLFLISFLFMLSFLFPSSLLCLIILLPFSSCFVSFPIHVQKFFHPMQCKKESFDVTCSF